MPSELIQHSSKSVEYYTPQHFTDLARILMGGIDLDPASCEQANETVQATNYYTKEENGLEQLWYGRVWMNPPYSKVGRISNKDVWSARLIEDYEHGPVKEALMLLTASTDTEWFKRLWYYPICFVSGRIKFLTPTGRPDGPPGPSVIVYLGRQNSRFRDMFEPDGRVVMP